MFTKNTKNKISYITLSLCLGAFLLTGIGYAFVQHLEQMYQTQARSTLTNAAFSIAHNFHSSLVDYQNYVDLLAQSFEKHAKTPENIDIALQHVEGSTDLFSFVGLIMQNHTVHVARQEGFDIHINKATISKLLATPKVFPTPCVTQVQGKDEHFIFFSSKILLSSGETALFFTGKRHTILQDILLPKKLQNTLRYAIINSQGDVLEDTLSRLKVGENILRTWAATPENSTELMHEISQNIAVGKPHFNKITYNDETYFVKIAPTEDKNWAVVVSVSQNTLEEPLERIIFILMGTGLLWFIFCVCMLFHFMRMQSKNSTNEQSKEQQQWLFDDVPAGIVRFKDDEHWSILQYGQSFLNVFNLTAEELTKDYDNCWENLIHPDDRARVRSSMDTLNQSEDPFAVLEYRIQTKDGAVVWILETARSMHDEQGSWYWSILTNITERKKVEMREKNTFERYRYLFEISENILYEYNWNTSKLRTTKQFFKKFGYPLPKERADYYPVDVDMIHPDDMDLFYSMQAKLQSGGNSTEALLRIKQVNGAWIWCQLRQAAWVDMADNATKAIGEIKNVDEETRNLQKLREDVQRDAFTGLYNKTASTELIKREISQSNTERGVLCIIDVDNFKQVNDNLGHAVGDIVIKNLATGLAKIFRSDDIVGRMGGDEYIVYIKHMPNLGVLLVKLDKVLEFFRQKLEGEGVEVNISCSIGIALFPSDADNYDDLYIRADKALYRSKKKKGIYTFYDAKIDH